jgi:hypothetical protein
MSPKRFRLPGPSTDLLRLRQENQRLVRASFRAPEEVVSWFGAIQAQDYLGALWALGLRMRSANEASVESALARRQLIRCWPMRGTLHFVAADDARWITQLVAPRVIKRNAARFKREFDVDAAVVDRARDAVTRALEGGRRVERAALYAALEARRIGTSKSRGLHILLWLAMDGTICLAGRAGKQHTFALLDEWIPKSRTYDREAALAELARRYFTSHGPATRSDFMWWAGITAQDAIAAISLAGPAIAAIRIDGTPYYGATTTPRPRSARKPRVSMLPAFDEYTVGYRDRSMLVAETRSHRAISLLGPVIVVDGLVVGNWKRTLTRERVTVETHLSKPMTRPEGEALASAAREYGEFLGMEAILKRK